MRTSRLTFNNIGAIQVAVITTTVLSYTSGAYRLLCCTDSGAIQITLPVAISGLAISIYNIGTNSVTIVLNGADTMNGVVGNQVLTSRPEAMELIGTTGNWNIAMPILPA